MKCSEMEVHSEVEACRTCGIFFLTSSNLLRYLFCNEPEIVLVRKELETWKMQLNENDAYPKYICTICLLEFHRIFKFQNAVLETQEQLQQLYNLQQENIQKIKIKTEMCEETDVTQKPAAVPKSLPPQDSNVCAFIYVDDLSDDEYSNHENRNISPFTIPHLPIKAEVIEEAYIPESEASLTSEMSVPALTQANEEVKDDVPVDENAIGIQCQLCLHVSEDQQQHRQHLLRIHESKPVECHVCGKQFPPGTTETRLKYHMKWHRINKHIKCAQCGFHCPSRDALKEHMRAVHTKTLCKICGKLLLPRKMRLHLEKHRKAVNTQELSCLYCASCFSTDEERNQHVSLYHNSAFEQLSMSSFGVHSEDLQSDTETAASSCETTSTTVVSSSPNERGQLSTDSDETAFEQEKETLENSDANMSEEYVEGLADCYAATEDTANNSNETNEHEEDELEETQFACAQCPESFNRVELLIAHAEIHTEKAKPFKCSVCGKAFDLKFSLNRHLKKHKNTTL